MKRQFLKRASILAAAITLTSVCGSARQPERGYRGFAEWTNRIYHTYYASNGKTYYEPGLSTSHGYQFNPWLFVGGGLDFSLNDIGYWGKHYYDVLNSNHLSLFIQGRTDLTFGKFTPFADVRLGWNASETGTVYFSPSLGYRFTWGRKVGINVGLGYTLDAYRYEDYITGKTPEGLTIYIPTGEYINWTRSSFTFRIGIDF